MLLLEIVFIRDFLERINWSEFMGEECVFLVKILEIVVVLEGFKGGNLIGIVYNYGVKKERGVVGIGFIFIFGIKMCEWFYGVSGVGWEERKIRLLFFFLF